jgi:ubiquinone/menaquinone biosynthesis C-methylase UbiE
VSAAVASPIGHLWDRVFASGYDRFLAGSERAGLSDRRRELVSEARGATLDLGAGTGLNLRHYPESVSRLVLLEPSAFMAAKLRERIQREVVAPRSVEVIEAGGERLPFGEAEFDTVVVTLVLCTIPDPAAALREVARVLRPGGTLLFLEHVRSPDPGLARWQDRLERPWVWFGNGCHCNRDTLATLQESPLAVERVSEDRIPKVVPLVRPMIVGAARAQGRS